MTLNSCFNSAGWQRRILTAMGLLIALLGLSVILAWHFYIIRWIQVVPGTSPMPYNTALGFFFAGLGVIGVAYNQIQFTKLTALVIILLGGISFAEYVTSINVGIDQLFFTPYIHDKVSHIGRIDPNTALCLLASGTALWIAVSNISSPVRPFMVSFLGTSAIGIAFVAFFGYLIDWESGYSWINLTHMSINSTIGVMLLGVAICMISFFPWEETRTLFKQWLPVYVAYNLLLVAALFLWARVNIREEGHVKEITQAQSNHITNVIQNSVNHTISGLKTTANNETLWGDISDEKWDIEMSEYLSTIPGAISITWINNDKQIKKSFPQEHLNLSQAMRSFWLNYKPNDKTSVIHIHNAQEMTDNILITTKIIVNGVYEGLLSLVIDTNIYFQTILKNSVNPDYSISLYENTNPIFVRGDQIETLNKELMSTSIIPLYGSRWTLESWPSQASLDAQKLSISLLIMIYGLTQQFITALAIYLTRVTKQRAEETQRSQKILQSIIDGTTTPIYVKDTNHKYMIVNKSFTNLYQLKQEQLIGKLDTEVLPKETASYFSHLDQEALNTGSTVSTEEQLGMRDKDQIYITERFPLYDMQQEIFAVCGIATNITQVKKSEEKLTESYKQLEAINIKLEKARYNAEQANIAKSSFLANMSHEIRTPLNGIVGITALLQNTEMNEKQEQYLSRIILSSQVLIKIINDILDFSKIEANELSLEYVSTDLHKLTKDIVDLLAPRAHEKNLELSIFLNVGYPYHIFIDPIRLGQVITNLIGNAIKFTKEGFILLRITSKYTNDNESLLRFEVIDSGVGIPHDKQERIFEKFSQADTSTTRKFGGTGLGLTISRQLVGLMEGNIGVSSEEDKGTQFWFEIPCKIDKEANKNATVLDHNSLLTGSSALIIHQPIVRRQVIEDYVSNWGMDFCSCSDLNQSLEILQKSSSNDQHFEYIIVDYHLEGIMNGDGLERIQALARVGGAQIILLIPMEEQGNIESLTEKGISSLSIPVDYLELYNILTSELKKKVKT